MYNSKNINIYIYIIYIPKILLNVVGREKRKSCLHFCMDNLGFVVMGFDL